MVADKIKNRVVYVYPSLEQTEGWRASAERQGLTLSKFVMEHVENSLKQEEDASYEPRARLIGRIGELEEALGEARKESRVLRAYSDKLEKENRSLRAAPFADQAQGIRQYEEDLIELLRQGNRLSEDQIFDRLGIDPTETDLVKAISSQLVNLESYGLVKSTPHGWKWSE